eukprot:g74378.t1
MVGQASRVSQKAAARLWETLGVLLCPRDVQWPVLQTLIGDIKRISQLEIFKKLQVCRKQCKLGLYWRDREQLNAFASCGRSRTTALTFYHRWFLVIPPISNSIELTEVCAEVALCCYENSIELTEVSRDTKRERDTSYHRIPPTIGPTPYLRTLLP